MDSPLTTIANVLLTLPISIVLYSFFGISYVVLFLWMHLGALVFARDREAAFQKINSWTYAALIAAVRVGAPGFHLRIAPDALAVRGGVVIANHLSFFDTVLMMAMYRRQKTIVKGVMFKVPFMGWAQNLAGYIPSHTGRPFDKVLTDRLDGLEAFFAAGGVLFVFPEGTRSRDGSLSPFKPGAFKIASRAGVPVEMLLFAGTERFFPTGRFLIRPFPGPPLTIDYLGRIDTREDGEPISVRQLIEQAESTYRTALGSAPRDQPTPDGP